MRQDRSNQFAVQFNQDSLAAKASDAPETAVALPQFENQLDLPTDRIQDRKLLDREHFDWDIGHKDCPGHQSKYFLAQSFLLTARLFLGFVAPPVRYFLRNRSINQSAPTAPQIQERSPGPPVPVASARR